MSFPATPQELFEYDAIVGFDPDWQRLDSEDIDRLERWVAEKAGGLIVIPGPVETDRWVQDPQYSKVAVPVSGRIQSPHGDAGRWQIRLRDALADRVYARRAGGRVSVAGRRRARRANPSGRRSPACMATSTCAARSREPRCMPTIPIPKSASSGQLPVYMAGQFFGAGRVFYLGSGEMWRLRALDDSYFEQFYTKLIRYVSQGRLLVGSSRGMLLVERDRYLLGSTVAVRAMLSNPQFEPLEAREVSLELVQPDSTVKTLKLTADPARKGMYLGQFAALQEGTYRLELAVPDSQEEHLSKRIQVKVPDLERENPERNDALLSEIAKQTGGRYYVGAAAMLGEQGCRRWPAN